MISALLNNNLLKLLDPKKNDLLTVEIPKEVVKDSKIIDPVAFSALVKQSVESKGWQGKRIACGLNEENTYSATALSTNDKDYLTKVNEAVASNIPHRPEELYITTEIVAKGEQGNRVQIAAVEKQFLDTLTNAFTEAGLTVDYFVPVTLALISLGREKEKPQLLVISEDKEATFIFVNEAGLVQFSATYPTDDLIKSTAEVVKYLNDKYPEQVIRKTLVLGKDSAKIVTNLKQNGLVVEETAFKEQEFPLLKLIEQFADAKLIFRPKGAAKEKSASANGGLLGIFGNKKEAKTESVTPEATPEPVASFEAQRLQEVEALPAKEAVPVSDFLENKSSGKKKIMLIGALGVAVLALLAVVLLVVKPWQKPASSVTPPVDNNTAPSIINQQPTTPEATPSAEVTPSEEPTASEAVDRSTYSIQVLNGRGTPGLAGTTKQTLVDLGYTNVETGNGNSRELSIVQYTEGNKDLAELLMKDLLNQFEFDTPELLEDSSSFDAIIIIGNK